MDEHGIGIPDPTSNYPKNSVKGGAEFEGILIPASLMFRKCLNQNILPYQKGQFAMEDVFGEVSFSLFGITVAGPHVQELLALGTKHSGGFNQHVFADFGTAVMNRFLDVYRVVTNKHWIPFCLRSRLSPWLTHVMGPENRIISSLQIDYRGTSVGAGSVLPSDQIRELERHCNSSRVRIDPAFQFLVRSNRAKQTGDWQTFVIYLAIYVEAWFYREIRYKKEFDGMKPAEIDSDFKMPNGRYKNLVPVLKEFVGKTKFDEFEKHPLYLGWQELLVKRRNDIAHGRPAVMTAEQAETTVTATMKFRDYAQKEFFTYARPDAASEDDERSRYELGTRVTD